MECLTQVIPNVDVGPNARLFVALTESGIGRTLSLVQQSLRERQVPAGLPLGRMPACHQRPCIRQARITPAEISRFTATL